MNKPTITYNELQKMINELKQINHVIITNYYNDEGYFNSLKDIEIIKFRNTIVLLIRYCEFNILYYWTKSAETLVDALLNIQLSQSYPTRLEILYRGNRDVVDNIIQNTTFKFYGGILRLQKKVTIEDVGYKNSHIFKATTYNIDEIKDMHSNIFNKYIDRHLEYTELYTLINNGNVLIYVDEKKILGCLIYTIRGKYYHLRYWFVDKKNSQHKQGIGKALIKELYNIAGVGNIIEVWSRKDNTIVTEIYEKYGFKKDGLESDILMYTSDSTVLKPLVPLN